MNARKVIGIALCCAAALWLCTGTSAWAGNPSAGVDVERLVSPNAPDQRNDQALVDYFEGFEDYVCGTAIVGQGGWEPWSGGFAGNARVDCDPDPVHTGDNSVSVLGNPNLRLADDLVRQFDIAGGVWRITAWQFVPEGIDEGESSYIWLNTYPASTNDHWSTTITMDLAADTVLFWEDDNALPLVEGAWVEIEVVADLITDNQTAFYNGELLIATGWTDAILEGEGLLEINAIDLWSNNVASRVYYDDINIEEIAPLGSACFADGSCEDNTPVEDCNWPDCFFKGFGTECQFQDCPTRGPDGWEVFAEDLPFQFRMDTTLSDDTCGFSTVGDEQFVIDIDHDGRYLFNACDAEWDNYLALGTTPCDFNTAENDDSEVCGGLQARIATDLVDLGDAFDYYLSLGSTFDESGEFGLLIREICVQSIADRSGEATVREDLDEPCGDDVNGGCNMDVPAFQAAACGDLVWGTFWYDGALRDTDWFEIDLDADTPMCLTANAEAGFIVGKIDQSETQDCEVVEVITPNDDVLPCPDKTAEVEWTQETTSTIWLFAASNFDDLNDCDDFDNYWMEISCTGCGGGEEFCPEDLDMSGVVDFGDILKVLSAWGNVGGPEDLDGSGTVDFGDILKILSGWGNVWPDCE